jgi:hypothetical protein
MITAKPKKESKLTNSIKGKNEIASIDLALSAFLLLTFKAAAISIKLKTLNQNQRNRIYSKFIPYPARKQALDVHYKN